MNVLIIEDETAAFKNLYSILSETDPALTVVGNTESVSQTINWLQSNPKPDLIFMDIHLSDGSAFNIFNFVSIETPIIFTTAYDEYAVDAFKVTGIDYLLKPIEPEDVTRALQKFRKLTQQDIVDYLRRMTKTIRHDNISENLLIPDNDKLIILKLNEVSCFYTDEGRTRIFLKDRRVFKYNKSLDSVIRTLDPDRFFRANKQFIISKDAVNELTIRPDNRLHIRLNIPVPEEVFVSKNKASHFKKWLEGTDER